MLNVRSAVLVQNQARL